jgi:hypothetical protein
MQRNGHRLAAIAVVGLLAGCGGSPNNYDVSLYRACLLKQHRKVLIKHYAGSVTLVIVTAVVPNGGEISVGSYFYSSAKAANRGRTRLDPSTRRSFVGQRRNALFLVPAARGRSEWYAVVKVCLAASD